MPGNGIPTTNGNAAADDAYPISVPNTDTPTDPNVKRQPKHAAVTDCQCDPLLDPYTDPDCHTHGIPVVKPEQPGEGTVGGR